MRIILLLCLALSLSAVEFSGGIAVSQPGWSAGVSFSSGGYGNCYPQQVYTRSCAQQSNFMPQVVYMEPVRPTTVYVVQQSNFSQVVYVHRSNFAPPQIVYPGRCR